jgi:hypothetical protein
MLNVLISVCWGLVFYSVQYRLAFGDRPRRPDELSVLIDVDRFQLCPHKNQREKNSVFREEVTKMPKLYYSAGSCSAASFIIAHTIGEE